MPRPPRVNFEDAVYYVTLEGPHDENIFNEPADYRAYLELLNRYRAQYGFKLYAYSLLPDRIHLLIQTSEAFSISSVMQKITPLYTKYFNRRYQRKGPLFQKRFRSMIVEKEPYLTPLTRYIHLSPLRSQLATGLTEYPYTSYGAYTYRHCETPEGSRSSPQSVGESVRTSLRHKTSADSSGRTRRRSVASFVASPLAMTEEVEEVVGRLGEEANESVYENYCRAADEEELEFLEKKLSRGFILGSEAFAVSVRQRMEDVTRQEASDLNRQKSSVFPSTQRMLAWSGALALAVVFNVYAFYLGNPPVRSIVKPFEMQGIRLRGPADEIKRILSELSNLEGTLWEVELIRRLPDGTERRIQDKIRFTGTNFESYYFSSQGFYPSNYTVTVKEQGVIIWETTQKNLKGEILSWRGDWRGNKIEGSLSYRPAGENPQDFSFMSKQLWGQK